jgi:hypothetical protein
MSSIPTHLKELLKNLEYLAMIEKGMKPCLSDMSFVDSNSYLGSLVRSRNSESKKQLLTYIDTVTEQTFAAIEDPRNKEYIPMIIHALERAKIGISNTETTYKKYPFFLSTIRVCLAGIDHRLKSYESPVDETK